MRFSVSSTILIWLKSFINDMLLSLREREHTFTQQYLRREGEAERQAA